MKKSEVIGAVAMANESAALTLLRRVYTGLACAALTQIPNGERLWDEIGEYLATRAAASPGAVTLTDDHRAAIRDAYDRLTTLGFPEILPVMRNLRGLLDAPQPAQVDAPAHAAECPPYTDYQLRVIYERAQLDERLKSLVLFVASEKFGELSEVDRSLLRRQSYLMFSLLCVLDRRIERFG